MKCSDCRYYAAKQSSVSTLSYVEGLGECRRNAPRGPLVLGWTSPAEGTDTIAHRPIVSPFPFVPADDWCGDFEQKHFPT
jgi:hypothetical protein